MAYRTPEEIAEAAGIPVTEIEPVEHWITGTVPIAQLDDEQLEAASIYTRGRLAEKRAEEREILLSRARRNVSAA